jgi:hypothetical protein
MQKATPRGAVSGITQVPKFYLLFCVQWPCRSYCRAASTSLSAIWPDGEQEYALLFACFALLLFAAARLALLCLVNLETSPRFFGVPFEALEVWLFKFVVGLMEIISLGANLQSIEIALPSS